MPDNTNPTNPDNVSRKSEDVPADPIRSHRKSEGLRDFTTTILILFTAVIVAWGLTLFVFQQYQVDGPSMEPTLENGNRLIVLKVAKTWSHITGHPYIPKRGDIVVLVEHDLYNLNGSTNDQLIKRVIGLPGDHLVIKNGKVTIYNKQYPKGFEPDVTLPYGGKIPYTSGNINIVIPAGQIFVFGDNRGDSLDSRVFGTVPVKYIIGQLVLRITPLSALEKF